MEVLLDEEEEEETLDVDVVGLGDSEVGVFLDDGDDDAAGCLSFVFPVCAVESFDAVPLLFDVDVDEAVVAVALADGSFILPRELDALLDVVVVVGGADDDSELGMEAFDADALLLSLWCSV